MGKTFNVVIGSGKDIFIKIYVSWCTHSKNLAPTYDRLGQHFSGSEDVIIAKIDATANDIPDPRFKVRQQNICFVELCLGKRISETEIPHE